METQTQSGLGQMLAGQIGVSGYVLDKNLDGITHQDSLVHPDSGGNSINWVLGHMVGGRNNLAMALTGEPVFSPARFAMYEGKADSGYTDEDALPLNELKDCCQALSDSLIGTLSGLDDEALGQPAPFSPLGNPEETLGSLSATFAFHDAYHAGQTGVLRRVCGKEGVLTAPDLDA